MIHGFFLISTEGPIPGEPHHCVPIKRLRDEVRDDYLLVSVDPPIKPDISVVGEAIHELVLATRLADESLFPISPWPCYVYVGRLRGASPATETITKEDLQILTFGNLFKTAEEARAYRSTPSS
jgi:hypothetical protein